MGVVSLGACDVRRPVVAVLPFECARHQAVTAEFGVGLSLAIADALVRISGIHVISPLSTLSLATRGRAPPWPEGQPPARYLVVGRVTQNDQVLTLNVRLRDVEQTVEILIEDLELHLSSLQDVQRDVVTQVLAVILPELREAEIDRALSRATSNVTAYEKLLQAMVAIHRQTYAEHLRAERLLEEAIAIDPAFADAYAWHARLLSVRIGQGWATDRREVSRKALESASEALWLDPDNALALAMAGHLQSYLHKRYREGLRLLTRAVEVCPNEPMAWLLFGMSLAYTGRAAEGRRHAKYALSLSPFDPFAYMYNSFIATCCYLAGDFEAAVRHGRLSAAENASYSTTFKVLALAFAALGDLSEARRAGARVLELEPGYPAIAAGSLPIEDPVERDLALRRLRSAGIDVELPRG